MYRLLLLIAFGFVSTCYGADKYFISCGLSDLKPYQYGDGGQKVTGLDAELLRLLAKESGSAVDFQKESVTGLLAEIRAGTKDMAMGGVPNKADEEFVYFSKPYRFAETNIFVRTEASEDFAFYNMSEMVDFLKASEIKIAVVEGRNYSSPELDNFINDPKSAPYIVKVASDAQSLKLLAGGKVGAFLADGLAGYALIWDNQLQKQITGVSLEIKTPISLMFSKASVPLSVVNKFNSAIEQAQSSGEYNNTITRYQTSSLFLRLLADDWFFVIDMLGIIAFALSGIIIAHRERITMFGAMVFAVVPSLGGVVLRNFYLNYQPIGMDLSTKYTAVALGIVAVCYVVLLGRRMFSKPHVRLFYETFDNDSGSSMWRMVLVATDALGMAVFSVSGVIIAIWANLEPLWLWGTIFAFLTGAGGRLLRDVLRKGKLSSIFGNEAYCEFSALSGFGLSLYITLYANELSMDLVRSAVIIAIAATFTLRMLTYVIRAGSSAIK